YAREGDCPTAVPRGLGKRFIGADLTSRKIARPKKGDPIARTLIRHDPDRLASLVVHKILKM
ncbi:MAG: hypothetical protein HY436_01250, partial [Candidatus Liptonbacteria bacterium]|nr:hypothetical protein [Candidatus Liptonbacteria bacterium]